MRVALRFSGRRYLQKRLKSGHALLQRTDSSAGSVDRSSTRRIPEAEDPHVGCRIHFLNRRSVRSAWTAPNLVANAHEARDSHCIPSVCDTTARHARPVNAFSAKRSESRERAHRSIGRARHRGAVDWKIYLNRPHGCGTMACMISDGRACLVSFKVPFG